APNNAVLSIVGDFEEAETRALVEKYFATIPSQPVPSIVDVSEPEEVAQTQENYYDKLAPAPAFVLGWKIPARRTPSYYALSLAADLLFEGDSSRLYQKLVKGDESVVSIQGGVDERRGPSAWYIFALPKPGEEVATIRNQIFDEIKSLATDGPTEAEMEKLRNSLSNDAVRGRQSTMYRAQRLAEYALYDGDPHLFDSELGHYLRVTPDEIKAAVSKFLDVENRVVLDIIPAALAEEDEQTAATASPLHAGAARQPSAPAAQITSPPSPDPVVSAKVEVTRERGEHPGKPQQPAETPEEAKTDSEPVHP
ncbi:MAG: M16 family metallopeptidase, partial [Pyrinomonadaceae bacterium]